MHGLADAYDAGLRMRIPAMLIKVQGLLMLMMLASCCQRMYSAGPADAHDAGLLLAFYRSTAIPRPDAASACKAQGLLMLLMLIFYCSNPSAASACAARGLIMMLASYCSNANPCPDDAHDARSACKAQGLLMLMMLASHCSNAHPCPDDAHDARDAGLALTAHAKRRAC